MRTETGGQGAWCDCDEDVELPPDRHARVRFAFRTISLFGVTGPEHRAEISYQPDSR